MTTRDTCASCTLMTPKAMYFFVQAASWKRRTLEIRFIEAPITNREQQAEERTFLVVDLAGFLPHSVQKYARPSIPRTRATSVALGQPTVVRGPAIGEPSSRTRIAQRTRDVGGSVETLYFRGDGTHALQLYNKNQAAVDAAWTAFLLRHLGLP